MSDTRVNRRLYSFYADLTSVDAILRALARDRPEAGPVTAADLYRRSLDCQNQGGFGLLERHAALVTEYSALGEGQRVLEAGCGLGGPGRYLADRFGCAVIGIDVLPARVQAAAVLTRLVGHGDRVAYCPADATRLPFAAHQFEQAWMLDVSIHIANKAALFGEVARVVKPAGLLVLHDQPGPLPPAMRPVTRRAPYIAPTLPQLMRYVEGAGFRVLTWRDTTETVLTHMHGRREELLQGVERDTRAAPPAAPAPPGDAHRLHGGPRPAGQPHRPPHRPAHGVGCRWCQAERRAASRRAHLVPVRRPAAACRRAPWTRSTSCARARLGQEREVVSTMSTAIETLDE